MSQARRILITGGSQGLGAAVARKLTDLGHVPVIVDIANPTDTEFEYHRVDLSDFESISSFVDGLNDPIDGLVNAAGVPGTCAADLVMRVNFAGLRELTERIVDKFTPTTVVHVSSLSASNWAESKSRIAPLIAARGFEAAVDWCRTADLSDSESYVFSKMAVIVLTTQQAAEFKDQGVRVNCVSPGPIDTRLLQDFKDSMGANHIDTAIQLAGGPGTPEGIAPVIAFLSTEDSIWVNGSNVNTDGGLHAFRSVANDTSLHAVAAK